MRTSPCTENVKYVGFVGAKGSGKTTSFNILAEQFPVNEVMIARKLKSVCSQLLGIPIEHMSDPKLKERVFEFPFQLQWTDVLFIAQEFDIYSNQNKADLYRHVGKYITSPRQAAQYVGTEIVRAVDPLAHLRSAEKQSVNYMHNIITDIRFTNEYDYFKKFDPEMMLVYIKRDSAEAEAAKDTHSSEAGLRELMTMADIVVDNNGSLEALEHQLFHLPMLMKGE